MEIQPGAKNIPKQTLHVPKTIRKETVRLLEKVPIQAKVFQVQNPTKNQQAVLQTLYNLELLRYNKYLQTCIEEDDELLESANEFAFSDQDMIESEDISDDSARESDEN